MCWYCNMINVYEIRYGYPLFRNICFKPILVCQNASPTLSLIDTPIFCNVLFHVLDVVKDSVWKPTVWNWEIEILRLDIWASQIAIVTIPGIMLVASRTPSRNR